MSYPLCIHLFHWFPSALVEGATSGKLVHLSGLDSIGATAGSLSRLFQDREFELWEGKRMVFDQVSSELVRGRPSNNHFSRLAMISSPLVPPFVL
jgi:von Willebrand factor A domain-containing protein 8